MKQWSNKYCEYKILLLFQVTNQMCSQLFVTKPNKMGIEFFMSLTVKLEQSIWCNFMVCRCVSLFWKRQYRIATRSSKHLKKLLDNSMICAQNMFLLAWFKCGNTLLIQKRIFSCFIHKFVCKSITVSSIINNIKWNVTWCIYWIGLLIDFFAQRLRKLLCH